MKNLILQNIKLIFFEILSSLALVKENTNIKFVDILRIFKNKKIHIHSKNIILLVLYTLREKKNLEIYLDIVTNFMTKKNIFLLFYSFKHILHIFLIIEFLNMSRSTIFFFFKVRIFGKNILVFWSTFWCSDNLPFLSS